MALERIPADIRYDGGVARMSDPDMILEIKKAVTIPVMAKVSIIIIIIKVTIIILLIFHFIVQVNYIFFYKFDII